jgi:D-glycero-alpha-D-manno-heptose-7-phosphate kinase
MNLYVRGYLIDSNEKSSNPRIKLTINDKKFENSFIESLKKYLNTYYGESLKRDIEINIQTPVMPGSGLGASSAIIVSSISLLARYNNQFMTRKKLLKSAHNCERDYIGVKGGYQDHCSAVYGGLRIYMKKAHRDVGQIRNKRVKVSRSFIHELESSFMLVDLNMYRAGENIIEDQQRKINIGDVTAISATQLQGEIAKKMLTALQNESIDTVAKLVNEAWEAKKRFSSLITNPKIDEAARIFLDSGAKAVKLTGAGGGGFMLVISSKHQHHKVLELAKRLNLTTVQLLVTDKGCQTWK